MSDTSQSFIGTSLPLPRRILLADDDNGARSVLSSFLESRGHSVRIVDCSPAALEIAPEFRPDVIFLDLHSPELNGWELCQQFRHEDALDRAAIFALMADTPAEYADRCRYAAFDAYLLKPVDLMLADRLVDCCPAEIRGITDDVLPLSAALRSQRENGDS